MACSRKYVYGDRSVLFPGARPFDPDSDSDPDAGGPVFTMSQEALPGFGIAVERNSLGKFSLRIIGYWYNRCGMRVASDSRGAIHENPYIFYATLGHSKIRNWVGDHGNDKF